MLLVDRTLHPSDAIAPPRFPKRIQSPTDFSVTPALEKRVEHWKEIFTRYTRGDLLIVHRDYPWIIYQHHKIDPTLAVERPAAFTQTRKRHERAAEREIAEVLSHLSNTLTPRNEQESKLLEQFKALGGDLRERLQTASNGERIIVQVGNRERFEGALIRAGRRLPQIESALRESGMPTELGRLPFIESSFTTSARSSVGAAGPWQFMPTTARGFGLRVTKQIDERLDFHFATEGAAKYLKVLHRSLFDSWPLAVTAWNAGPGIMGKPTAGGVHRAVAETGSKDLATIIENHTTKNFVYYPKNFFPELLAAIEIEKNKERYFPGITARQEQTPENALYRLNRSLRMTTVLRALGQTFEEFRVENPAVLTRSATLPKGFRLRLTEEEHQRLERTVPGLSTKTH